MKPPKVSSRPQKRALLRMRADRKRKRQPSSGWWRSSIGADTSIFWCHKREQISVEAYPRGKCIYTAPYLPILNNLRKYLPSFYRGTRSVRPAGLGLLGVLDGPGATKFGVFPLLFLPILLFIRKSNSLWSIKDNIETSQMRSNRKSVPPRRAEQNPMTTSSTSVRG